MYKFEFGSVRRFSKMHTSSVQETQLDERSGGGDKVPKYSRSAFCLWTPPERFGKEP
jgi:hypothetical protein